MEYTTLCTILFSSQNFEFLTSKAQSCFLPFNNSTNPNQYGSCFACINLRVMNTFIYVLCLFDWPSVFVPHGVKGGIHSFQWESPLNEHSILLSTKLKMFQLRVHNSPRSLKLLRHKGMRDTCGCVRWTYVNLFPNTQNYE